MRGKSRENEYSLSRELETLRYRPKLRLLKGEDVAREVNVVVVAGTRRLEVRVQNLMIDPTDMFSADGRTNYEIIMGKKGEIDREKITREVFIPDP